MPIQPTLTRGPLVEATILRQQAGDLLNRLMVDREAAERRQAETGRRDPLKAVTGTTALERAIASTREMISQMDVMFRELDEGLRSEDGAVEETPALQHTGSPASATRRPRKGMLMGKRPVPASA